MHLAQTSEHILRLEVEGQCTACGQAEVSPSAFKYMCERQEGEREVFVREPYSPIVGMNASHIHAVGKHHTLTQSGGSAGIEYVGQIVPVQLAGAYLHFILMLQMFAHVQEFIEVDAHLILRILLHAAVEDNQFAHLGIYLQHPVGRIILVLFTYKDEPYLGVTHHVLHLHLTAGSIEGDGDSPDGIRAEIHIQAFGLVLREYHNVLLHPHTQLQQRVAHLLHPQRELVPGYVVPLA